MDAQILVDDDEFWSQLDADIRGAKSEVLLQMMTWEGDRVGLRVGDALLANPHAHRAILVDNYSRHVVSDRFVHSPWAKRDPVLQAEVKATTDLFERLSADGVDVTFTNPVGPFFLRFPARNHKKIIVIDEKVAYLGGFNFSDHNFSWHDMMVRFEDEEIAAFLREDFEATRTGQQRLLTRVFPKCSIHAMDGLTNEQGFQPLIDLLAKAKRTVHVVSPYMTFPFCETLEKLSARGVTVTLLTPRPNNKGIVRDYLLWRSRSAGFEIRLLDRMSHMKAMLIDDEHLVIGSSNFDFLSYRIEQEVIAVLSDPDVIARFRERILDVDLAASIPLEEEPSAWKGVASLAALKLVDGLAVVAKHLITSS